ncbi:putative transcriptional regulator, Crp/Fnr family [[Leptolyngbya] sp. PCC 7376]|uniref:cyclic nucleotide-binding domain-containing protein n=1 Tax=[Leptolyngbya] sp. PCC 7376 TaxID=111781 RepID=UPI00029EDE00|nr:cyclic nucleotide-binding domain-containing protein [[Leptolyngbya] sp. PCC 7376]AFY39057.1 putative transcriptional regulator, Crp/Fnr family [[Leptolyngbya] sp. PCC 7376]
MQKVLFLFGELNDDDIDWLITAGNIARVQPNKALIQENQPLENLYILLEGSVSVSILAVDQVREIAVLNNGEIFGELSFMDNRLPTASVETLEECLILSIPRQQISNRLQQDIGFSARFYRAIATFLANRLRNTVSTLGQDKDFVFNQSISVDELPDSALENFELASTRFDWLLRRVKSQTMLKQKS